MSDLDLQLQAVREAMDEPNMDEIYVESALHSLVVHADDLIIALNKPETAPYVIRNKIAAGQALTRIQLLVSSIMAMDEPRLRVVKGHA